MRMFKVGDRIRVFESSHIGPHYTDGTVAHVFEEGHMEFMPDTGVYTNTWYVHPKQCRRLVPKVEITSFWRRLWRSVKALYER